MKTTKKTLAIVLAVVMMAALCLPAMAADAGTITIKNATPGETYKVYKLFDIEYNASTGAFVGYSCSAAELIAALAESPFTVTELGTTGKVGVALADGKGIDDIKNFVTALAAADPAVLTAACTQDADASGKVVFETLANGYYFVESSLGTVVTLDNVNTDAVVYDKNQGPTWDNGGDPEDPEDPTPDDGTTQPGKVIIENGKKVTENTVNYGETVNFSIAVNATAYVMNEGEPELVTYYYIYDTMEPGFTFDSSSVAVNVYALQANGTYSSTATPLTAGTDYVLSTPEGKTFEVSIPFGELYGTHAKIEVTYSATVNTDAVLGGEGNLNTATFNYVSIPADGEDPSDPTDDPDPKDPEEWPDPTDPGNGDDPRTTTTYVFELDINKVIEGTSTPIENVVFELYTDSECTEKVATGAKAEGIYAYVKDGSNSQFVTDTNGKIVITGLAGGTYYLKEISAPAGYNMKADPTEIVLSKTTAVTSTANTDNTAVSVTIENGTGTELPATGSVGTTLFIVFGSVVMLAAGVVLVTNKRMKKENYSF